MDVVRSMMGTCNLPEFLWVGALKAAAHVLNRVPSKYFPITLFELWVERKSSLNHFVLGVVRQKSKYIFLS